MRTHHSTAALAAIAAALSLTACSSSSDKPDAAPPTATTAAAPAADNGTNALTAAVHAYSAAYFKPDTDAAYALLSARCQTTSPQAIYAPIVTAAAKAYGHQTIQTLHVDQLSGNLARVTYTYAVPALDQHAQPWTREHGAWHYDAC